MTVAIAVLGAEGRMGRLVAAQVRAAEDLVLVAEVDRGQVGPDCFGSAAVVIDFSLPEGLVHALGHLGSRALVSGTTGLTPAQESLRADHAQRAPLLVAANFSVGVHALLALVGRAAAALPLADIEVVEMHHRHKVDAPSGTAYALAKAVADARGVAVDDAIVHGRAGTTGARPAGRIGMHAIRGGDVPGEHTVWFLADGERIALSHSASSRSTFASGAVLAARWLAGRPAGRYEMAEVLGL